ncbi:hypothetical protein COOONC_28157, partial [Cooperia oncophora]
LLYRGIYLLLRVKLDIRRRFKANRPIHEVFLERVREHPRKVACIEVETGRQVLFDELNNLTNKYANYFASLGYKKGDIVALYMENCIDFFALWLGLSKVTSFLSSLQGGLLGRGILFQKVFSAWIAPFITVTKRTD